ncbi:hypothetical protein MW887_010784 [Aspergillus wentii]|nr:hypothetical protein MW887_010784 [Aspergillus wentii]
MIVLFLFLASIVAGLPSDAPTVIIDSGAIVGTTTTPLSSITTVRKYLGIPYAAPPNRFSPPEPVKPWSNIYNATKFGTACIQQIGAQAEGLFDGMGIPPPLGGEGEDCLNLNVFTPASASAGSKAVLVWLYGGAFLNGASAVPMYDGSSFAANQDVVVVTVNYRTNLFGFPADSSIPLEERNLGLLDQRLALDWVTRNIAALGGNPFKITLMGESSGGNSVDALLISPPDPLPFHAAIMQSGQSSIPDPFGSPAKAYAESWQNLTRLAGCPTNDALDCLRTRSAFSLKELAVNNSMSWGTIPDGGRTYSTTPRLDRLNSTQQGSSIARVPILIGSNADEAKPFVKALPNNTRNALLTLGLDKNMTNTILHRYPLGAPGATTETDRLSLIATDVGVQCPIKLLADDSIKADIPTWRYYFNASFPNYELFPGSGAYHAAEIPFVFGTYPQTGATEFEHQVSQAMQKAWADFAKDPMKGPGWEQVPAIGVFGDGVKARMSSEGKHALKAVSDKEIDPRCDLYQPIYDKATLRSL